MNKDLKDIQKWRQLTESILNEENNKWIVFVGDDDELEEGEEARMLAYQAESGEEDIANDMSASEALRLQSQVEDENRETKQVDVVYRDGDYECDDENVIFIKTA